MVTNNHNSVRDNNRLITNRPDNRINKVLPRETIE